MADLGQAQTGTRSSTPKIVSIKGDDNLKVVYKNMGNNHTYPIMWADTVTMVSGATSVVVASGVKWHGLELATNGNVTATALGDTNGYLYITKDTAANTVTVNSSAAVTTSGGVDIDVKYMMGEASSARYIEDIFCRGNTGASQALP